MNGGWLLVLFCCHSDEGLHSTATLSCVIFTQPKGFRQGSDWSVCCPTAEGYSHFEHSTKWMFSTFAASGFLSVTKDFQAIMITKFSEFHKNTAKYFLLIQCRGTSSVENKVFLTEFQIVTSEEGHWGKVPGFSLNCFFEFSASKF